MARTDFRTEADYDTFTRTELAAAVAQSDVELGDVANIAVAYAAREGEPKGHLRRIATRRQLAI